MPVLNPITKDKEFGGVPGAFAITTGLPALIILFYFLCNEGYVIDGSKINLQAVKSQIFKLDWLQVAFDCQIWKFYLSWFFGLLALDLVVPGIKLQGIALRDNTKLTYKINGLNFVLILTVALLIRGFLLGGYLPELEFVYDNLLQLSVVAILFSFLLATFVYVCSYIPLRKANGFKTKERILSINGNSSSAFYNWFIGRELNPRIGPVDIKLFCELKPGLLLWLVINLSTIHHQYWTNNGTVYDSLILINLLQLFYIVDGVLNEAGVISMIDITTDGFGFMLAFGDLALVPFTYSLQARYLCLKPVQLGPAACAAIVILMLTGYHIFHQSNKQKSDWKAGKLNDRNYSFIKTKTGSRLLCDGWWGYSQHINYFGDWIISWSWCLATGFNTPLTYYYVAYFGGLLLHRQQRDDAKCAAKYGEKWEQYKKKVPYKIVPYLY